MGNEGNLDKFKGKGGTFAALRKVGTAKLLK
jgi:hypothetical protein